MAVTNEHYIASRHEWSTRMVTERFLPNGGFAEGKTYRTSEPTFRVACACGSTFDADTMNDARKAFRAHVDFTRTGDTEAVQS